MQTMAINQGMAIGQAGTAVQAGMGQPGGDFMQLILQMMGGDPDGMKALLQDAPEGSGLEQLLGAEESTDADKLADLLGQQGDNEQDTDYLMQLMAAMLAHGTPQIALYNGEEQVAQQLNQPSFADVVASGANLPIWSTGAQPGEQSPVEGMIAPDGRVIPYSEALPKGGEIPLEVLTGKEMPQPTIPQQEAQIQGAFAAGKQQMPQLPTGEKKSQGILDIDALQQAVDGGRYLPGGIEAARLDTLTNPQTRDILAQVKTGILSKLHKGDNEFIIKLSPEGLGEITVKMTETAGKVSMSIITSSQTAHNALASELSTLREALRPLGAEVTQLMTQQEANLSQSFAESRQGKQQQAQQQAQQWARQAGTDDSAQQQEYTAALGSALNAYI